jgi:sugar phosphate isomerase/epimerase
MRITVTLFILAFTLLLQHCKPNKDTNSNVKQLNISLAQWSLHRAFQEGKLQAEDFAAIAKNEYGISAVEYVNGFYRDKAKDETFWKMMRNRADSLGVKNLLIMIDEEGDLGNPDSVARKNAVENHFKWVNAADILGCHSIRINAFGDGTREQVQTAMVQSLKTLCAYARKVNINVLIENHGLYSSDGKWVAEIMKQVNMPNCGTLPDFGNWCTSHKWGSTETGKECNAQYDRYLGVADFLPFAKGVSAKSYSFTAEGDEEIIDYSRLMKLVKESGFDGYVGIEFEGSGISEPDGIRTTKSLLEKTWAKL